MFVRCKTFPGERCLVDGSAVRHGARPADICRSPYRGRGKKSGRLYGCDGRPARNIPLRILNFLICPILTTRSEEHTSELQSRGHLVCRLLLEKKKKQKT